MRSDIDDNKADAKKGRVGDRDNINKYEVSKWQR